MGTNPHFFDVEHPLSLPKLFFTPETDPPDMALSSLQASQARGIAASRWYQIGSHPHST